MTDALLAEERLKIIRILLDALAELDPNPDSVKRRIKRIARKYDVSDLIDSANLDDTTKDILHRRLSCTKMTPALPTGLAILSAQSGQKSTRQCPSCKI